MRARRTSPLRSSPRPWGCFPRRWRLRVPWRVFPTPVGVFLLLIGLYLGRLRLPHARGGVSNGSLSYGISLRSSPRPWGCFYCLMHLSASHFVFPTPVGVFLPMLSPRFLSTSLPHARGGVSHEAAGGVENDLSSPRPWGCFYRARHAPPIFTVFPTPVGVFPDVKVQGTPASASDSANERRLCLRGGRLLRSRMNIFKPKTL